MPPLNNYGIFNSISKIKLSLLCKIFGCKHKLIDKNKKNGVTFEYYECKRKRCNSAWTSVSVMEEKM